MIDEAAKTRDALLDDAVAGCQWEEREEALVHAEVDEQIPCHLLTNLGMGGCKVSDGFKGTTQQSLSTLVTHQVSCSYLVDDLAIAARCPDKTICCDQTFRYDRVVQPRASVEYSALERQILVEEM